MSSNATAAPCRVNTSTSSSSAPPSGREGCAKYSSHGSKMMVGGFFLIMYHDIVFVKHKVYVSKTRLHKALWGSYCQRCIFNGTLYQILECRNEGSARGLKCESFRADGLYTVLYKK